MGKRFSRHFFFPSLRCLIINNLSAKLIERLLSKANEVFMVSVDVRELDVYQQQNL